MIRHESVSKTYQNASKKRNIYECYVEELSYESSEEIQLSASVKLISKTKNHSIHFVSTDCSLRALKIMNEDNPSA